MDPGSIPLVCGPQGFNTRRTWHEKCGENAAIIIGQHRNHVSRYLKTKLLCGKNTASQASVHKSHTPQTNETLHSHNWSSVLEKPTLAPPLKKFLAFHGT